MKEIELTEDQKQAIVDEANDTSEVSEESNTSLFNMGDLDELKPFLEELTPLDMFDKSVAMSKTSMANLDDLLHRLSKKNIIKLFFATMQLPEDGSVLKFGGTKEDKALCEIAFANSQMARNCLVHILGTSAIAQAKLTKKKEMELAEQESEADIKEE